MSLANETFEYFLNILIKTNLKRDENAIKRGFSPRIRNIYNIFVCIKIDNILVSIGKTVNEEAN